MLPQFKFNERVAVEAILYIITRSQHPDFYHVVKLLYFADLLHLERYGRFICGDRYVAMKDGPVPSGVYDILKAERNGVTYCSFPAAQGAFEVYGARGYDLRALREPDEDWLTEASIECLDEAIRRYDHLDFGQLRALSHGTAWKSADENNSIELEAIVEQVGNPEGLLEYLQDPHP